MLLGVERLFFRGVTMCQAGRRDCGLWDLAHTYPLADKIEVPPLRQLGRELLEQSR